MIYILNEVKANFHIQFKDILNNKSNNNKNILSNVQPKNKKITAYNYDTELLIV